MTWFLVFGARCQLRWPAGQVHGRTVALADIPKVAPRGYPIDNLSLREGAAMDIGAWLKELGLGQYASAFADNDIDFAVVVQLTDADLKELGISSLGHRKRLLAAIAEKGLAAPAGTVHTSTVSEGERRQVTILFADLCGFTALSQSLDPEEVRELVSRYTALVDGIVVGYGGTVDKHIGDAVMALFGAPRAHDDDPMRAARAAVDIHEALTQLSETVSRPLQAHVGIANGEVVAGTVDRADVHDYTVLGDSVNLAARLVAAAGPGQTLIDGVYRALSGRGACDALGEIDLKGLARSVPATKRFIESLRKSRRNHTARIKKTARFHTGWVIRYRCVGRQCQSRSEIVLLAQPVDATLGANWP